MDDLQAYRVLEVEPGAGAKAVQAAYRRKALALHPDRAGSQEESKLFYRRFIEVRDAYELLRKEGFPAPAAPPPEPEVAAPEMPEKWDSWEDWVVSRPMPKDRVVTHVSELEKLGFEFHFDPPTVILWGIVIPGGIYGLVRFLKFLADAVRGPDGG